LSSDPHWIGRDVRITVKIASHDRRLHSMPRLMKRLSAKEIAAMDGIAVQAAQADWRTFWIYERDVALNRFSKVEIATRAAA
jgi:hypothetical protein